MAEIIKVYKEHLPTMRFIGKRYTNADRGSDGGFGHKWGEWFENGWFELLEQLGQNENYDNSYLGFMRCNGSDFENTFEYWIGMFLPPDTEAPEGYNSIDLDGGNAGICWIKGSDSDGSIYNMNDACVSKFQENDMGNFKSDNENRAYIFERYNCPRFTEKDEQGNVILDYGIYLAE